MEPNIAETPTRPVQSPLKTTPRLRDTLSRMGEREVGGERLIFTPARWIQISGRDRGGA